MKIQCTSCDAVVPIGAFRITDGGIHVTCTACAASYFVAAEPAHPVEPETQPKPPSQRAPGDGEMLCPKCDTLQSKRDACTVCGLRRALFDGFQGESEVEASPVLAALWTKCQAAWDEPERHRQFVETASVERAFAYAARCYRTALRARPEDETAREHIERLSRMAEVSLLGGGAARAQAAAEPEPYRNVIILIMVLLLIAGAVGMYVLVRGNAAAGDPPPPPVPSGATMTPGR